MNLAFSAVFILFFLIPGAILFYTYSRGPWWGVYSQIGDPSITLPSFLDPAGGIVNTVFGSVVLHAVWAALWTSSGAQINLESAIMLFLNSYGKDDQYFEAAIRSITDYVVPIGIYFVSLCSIAAIIGWGSHYVVRKRKWDLKYPLFRFNNDWHYLLTGEILEFSEYAELYPELSDIDGTYFSAVIELNGINYLYRGIVIDWSFDKSSQLDTITLFLAHRRKLEDDRKPDQEHAQDPIKSGDIRYYPIVGQYFILKYKDLKTINIEYIKITQQNNRKE